MSLFLRKGPFIMVKVVRTPRFSRLYFSSEQLSGIETFGAKWSPRARVNKRKRREISYISAKYVPQEETPQPLKIGRRVS